MTENDKDYRYVMTENDKDYRYLMSENDKDYRYVMTENDKNYRYVMTENDKDYQYVMTENDKDFRYVTIAMWVCDLASSIKTLETKYGMQITGPDASLNAKDNGHKQQTTETNNITIFQLRLFAERRKIEEKQIE